MADKKDVFGAIEDGTYSTAAPNPHVDLAGTMPSDAKIKQLFDTALATGETVTITVWKDATNWAVYEGADFTSGTPDELDLSAGTLIDSAGSISNSDSVEVWVDEPYYDLLISAQTMTGSDLSIEPGHSYQITCSGITADRYLNVKAGAAGDEAEIVLLTDADTSTDAYELVLRGDSTDSVTLDGVAAGTEWSRLLVARESVRLRWRTATAVEVVSQKLSDLYSFVRNAGTGDTQTFSSGTSDVNTTVLSVTDSDVASQVGASGSTRTITARRAGRWEVGGLCVIAGLADGYQTFTRIEHGADSYILSRGINGGTGPSGYGGATSIPSVDVGDDVNLAVYHTDPTNRASYDGARYVYFWGRWLAR